MPVVWITARRLPISAGRAVTGTTVTSDDSGGGATRLHPKAGASAVMAMMRKGKVRVS